MRRLAMVALAVCGVAWAAAPVPVSHHADRADLGNGKQRLTLYSYPKYYRDAQQRWQPTRERFVLNGQQWVAGEGVHRCAVRRDGYVLATHRGHVLTLQLRAIVGLASTGGNEHEAIPVRLGQWTFDTSKAAHGVLIWTHPATGAQYRIRYVADGIRDRFILTPAARAAIKARLGPTHRRIGLVFDCTMPPGLTRHVGGQQQTEHDTEQAIYLRGGGVRQRLRPAHLPHRTDPKHAGWRERWRYRNGRLVQSVPLDALDHVAELRTTVQYQEGVDDPNTVDVDVYSGCEDVSIRGNYSANFGASAQIDITGPANKSTLIRFDVSAIPAGSTIDSASLDITVSSRAGNSGEKTFEMYRCLQPWVEGTGDATAPPHGGADDWHYEEPDGHWDAQHAATSGTDYSAILSAEFEQDFAGYPSLVLSEAQMATDVSLWVEGTQNNGWIIHPEGSASNYYIWARSSEYGTAADRPKLTIDYTAASTQVMPIISSAGIHNALFHGLVIQG